MSQFDPQQRNLSKVRLAIRRAFPERQIILRSGEKIRSLRLSTVSQVAFVCAGVALGGWVAFSSVMVVGHDQIIAAKNAEVNRARAAYKGLLAQVSVYKERIGAITGSLERNHAHIVSLVDQNTTLDERLASMREELALTAEEKERIEKQSADLASEIKKLKTEVASAARSGAEAGEGGDIDPTDVVGLRRAAADRERESLYAELQMIESDLGRSPTTEIVATDLDGIEVELRRVILQRDLALGERDGLKTRIGDLERQIAEMENTQLALYNRFSDIAADKISEVEKTLSKTGIDLPALVAKTNRRYGQGGPFVPDSAVEENQTPLTRGLDKVSLKLDHLDTLDRVAQQLPLSAPLVEDYRITSLFGRRADPINGRGAVHEGLDMAAAYKSPVTASAPGKVVYAGWRGRYGRLVEIDHGMGIRTRFGHLAKITVKKGQRVERGDEVGLLGNSGRSTGAHLHYEVLVNGEPHDPLKFIKAGSDVFKG
ncbi:MAG: peptidoglycan DD-metalloendopeptidase family protein [Caenispirillum sp.]|nr:peptidoglycan DD-metalloendopeptidase family protein [Caenispirillum sp.]